MAMGIANVLADGMSMGFGGEKVWFFEAAPVACVAASISPPNPSRPWRRWRSRQAQALTAGGGALLPADWQRCLRHCRQAIAAAGNAAGSIWLRCMRKCNAYFVCLLTDECVMIIIQDMCQV